MWPVGQAVKTSPFHGGNGGSIPPRVTNFYNIGTYCFLAVVLFIYWVCYPSPKGEGKFKFRAFSSVG